MNETPASSKRAPLLVSLLILSVLFRFSGIAPLEPGAVIGVASPPSALPEPEIMAHAYIVRLAGSPIPILKRREWKPLAPASITKLMTAVVAREIVGADEWIYFSSDAKSVEEKISGVGAGDSLSRDDAIRMALIESDNDAASALAEYAGRKLGGSDFIESVSRFAALMNRKAKLLSMAHTHFVNPTGLDEDAHAASAEDFAKLAEYISLAHPGLWTISKTTDTVVYSHDGESYSVVPTNKLLHEFPAIIGGKTGLTDRAKGTFMFLYPVRGQGTAIIVILGSDDRFGDGRKIIRWLEESYP